MACSVIFILSLINTSCNKEPGDGRDRTRVSPPPLPQPPLPPPPPPASSNQNIWVHANMDITIELPMNFALLNGGTSGPGRMGAKVKWEKISGPASYFFRIPRLRKNKSDKP